MLKYHEEEAHLQMWTVSDKPLTCSASLDGWRIWRNYSRLWKCIFLSIYFWTSTLYLINTWLKISFFFLRKCLIPPNILYSKTYNLLKANSFIYLFFGCTTACGILVPWLGTQTPATALKAWSLNLWSTTEVPKIQ